MSLLSSKLPSHLFEQSGDELSCIDRFLGDEIVTQLANLMSNDKTKRKLTLRGNCIAEKGALSLSEMLKTNTYLEQLSLDWNLVGNIGVRYLTKGLELNIGIVQLDLRNNGVGDEGAAALSAIFKSNNSIQRLDLRWNQITDKGAKSLLATMKENQTKISIMLHGNPITPSVLQKFEMEDKIPEPQETSTLETQANQMRSSMAYHEGFLGGLQKENIHLRSQIISTQTLLADQQRQLDASALKIIEFEQEKNRVLFAMEQCQEELIGTKLRNSQLLDELKQANILFERERLDILDKQKALASNSDMERSALRGEISSLQSKLKISETSCTHAQGLLEESRIKHKSEIDDWEMKWRKEYQKGFETAQELKDTQQKGMELKDELQSAKHLVKHYEEMMQGYEKRLEEINSNHSVQFQKLLENHRREMQQFNDQSSQLSAVISGLHAKNAELETTIASLEVEKIQECEQAAAIEREAIGAKYSVQLNELKSRLEGYLNSKCLLEEKCLKLNEELSNTRKENELFNNDMKKTRDALIEDYSKLQNNFNEIKSAKVILEGNYKKMEADYTDSKSKLEEVTNDRNDVRLELQELSKTKFRLTEQVESLKHQLFILHASKSEEFERIQAGVTHAVAKELENLKLQLKIAKPHKSHKSPRET